MVDFPKGWQQAEDAYYKNHAPYDEEAECNNCGCMSDEEEVCKYCGASCCSNCICDHEEECSEDYEGEE